jgi:hypothetical protein
MELHKVKIFPKNEDFFSEIVEYLSENSKVFMREFSIDNILNESHSLPHLIEKLSPIPIDEKYGSTFQSHHRNNEPSYISHTIHSISIEGDNYYANIELWRLTYNDLMILRPVYHKPKGSSEYKIGTFDLDYDITHNRA